MPNDDSSRCYCRRCLIHDDPGGCLVDEQLAKGEPTITQQPTPNLPDTDPDFVCRHGNPTYGQWPGDFCQQCYEDQLAENEQHPLGPARTYRGWWLA